MSTALLTFLRTTNNNESDPASPHSLGCIPEFGFCELASEQPSQRGVEASTAAAAGERISPAIGLLVMQRMA